MNEAKADLIHIWDGMIQRCYRPISDHVARYYRDAGIQVDERWHTFENFYADMGPDRPEGRTLDRIDSTKNYGPDNCRWATPKEQSNNRRNNVWIEHDHRRLTLAQWSDISGVHPETIKWRIQNGWPKEKAIFQQARGCGFKGPGSKSKPAKAGSNVSGQ